MKKQHCVTMEEELARDVKIACAKNGWNFGQFIEYACKEFLDYLKMEEDVLKQFDEKIAE